VIVKDVYYELLLSAAEGILEKGLISLEEIYVTETLCIAGSELRRCDNRTCSSSGPKKDQMWNRVKQCNKYLWLCVDCFKAFKNGQFCYYCSTIYRDDLNDYIHTWIQCDYCELWHHLHCEESKGDYPNIAKQIQDQNFKYMCFPCRTKNPKAKRSKLLGQKTKGAELVCNSSGNKRKKEDLYGKGYSNSTILSKGNIFNLGNIDSRDIYHDFYKIANIKGK
jgi:hypothetical protein